MNLMRATSIGSFWNAARRASGGTRLVEIRAVPVRPLQQLRRLATSQFETASPTPSPPPPPANKPKAKPNKSPSALRRTASASLPIRSNPTPTRGQIQSVFTMSTAERYQLGRLRPLLPENAVLFEDAWCIPRWGVGKGADRKEGEVWIFGNGSFVCWGLDEDEARIFARDVIKRANMELGPVSEAETEELDFVTDPTEVTRLQGDLIILGHAPPLSDPSILPTFDPSAHPLLPIETFPARYAFSQALARSTALSTVETSLDSYLSSVSRLPLALSSRGKPGLTRKELIKKLGQLMHFRQGVNLNRENFGDTPDLYWEEPALEKYFNSVIETLEIRSRKNALNAKITYAAELQSILRELLAESSGHRMELIIIALIAVEVVIAIIRDGPELWQMVTGEGEKPATEHKRRH